MDYYQQSIKQVFSRLNSSVKGLTAAQASQRLATDGKNVLKPRQRFPVELRILFNQFSNVFFVLLVAASLISWYLEEYHQLVILVTVIIINVLVGFIEEYKAERALQKLKKELAHFSWCFRDGRLTKVPVVNLVVGDVVRLREGDKVPADLRIIESKNLQINQAVLTGESNPAPKSSQAIAEKRPITGQINMVFAATSVLTGRGKGVVTATGNQTQVSKIAQLLEGPRIHTPLERKLDSLARVFLVIVTVMGLIVFFLGWLSQELPLGQLLTFVIALLVSAVPESLPTIIVLTLAMGVLRMAQQKSIVKRLPAVEALGDVDVICTDKTGTLTKNEMTVKKVIWLKKGKILERDIPGAGFEARPRLKVDGSLRLVLETAILANDTTLKPISAHSAEFFVVGDPTEGAVLIAGLKAGIDIERLRNHFPPDDEIVFDSSYKYEATLSQGKIFVMGALEVLLKKSSLHPRLSLKILERADFLAKQGLRIVGIFQGRSSEDKLRNEHIKDLEFLGFVAMMDPVREGVRQALKQVEQAGIEVKIITGDHPATTQTAAAQIGIKVSPGQILTGEQLAKIPARGLEKKVRGIKIFARVIPEQKFKIVRALQAQGQIVAVTGDGVNDAPALKRAEIGIAMGQRGTEVAREVADLVLLDDSFDTIVRAVGLGRNILANIKKFVTFLLSTNFVELPLVMIAFLAGLPIPFVAVQILWINLVTDTLPALALAFEKSSQKVLPKFKSRQFMRPVIKKAIILSLIALVLELAVFVIKLPQGVEYARTLVFNIVVFFQLMIVFSIRSGQPFWKTNPFSNLWLVGAVVISIGLQLITYLPSLSSFFKVVSLSFQDFGLIIGVGATGFILAELTKLVTRQPVASQRQ
jgi:Ca2+-transporting ATPase